MRQSIRPRPKQLIIPDEFNPDHKITNKKFAKTLIPTYYASKSSPTSPIQEKKCLTKELRHEPQKVTSRSMRSQSQQPEQNKKITILEDEELISIREQTKNSYDFDSVAPEKLDFLYQHIKEYIKFLSSEAQYDEASEYRKQLQALTDYQFHQKHDFVRSNEPVEIYDADLKKQEEKWQKEIDDYDLETSNKTEQLHAHHQEENSQLENYWGCEDTQRKYRKPTGRLLGLWKQEKFLAKTGQFDEAKIVRAEAEELEKREINYAQKQLDRDFHIAKSKLDEKQAAELNSLQEERLHWRDIMISRQKTEKSVYENRKMVVDLRQKDPPRTKEPLLNTKTLSRGPETKRPYTIPGIDFQYHTVLPPLIPPSKASPNNNNENGSAPPETQSNNDGAGCEEAVNEN